MSAISLEEAITILTSATTPISERVEVTLAEAKGMILAEDVRAPHPQPPFSRSPLDGYALRAEDTKSASPEAPVQLKVIDKIMAGSVSEKEVGKGTAIRIMTGAPIPKGADCVIRQEHTDYGEDVVLVYQELLHHDNICDLGEDYPKGALLLEKGEKIDAIAIGILAGAGIGKVMVYRKPKIALFTSGDELLEPGEQIIPGKIYNTNQYLLRARLEELGVAPMLCTQVPDEPEAAANAIRQATEEADLVLTTGGVSVGQKDIMHEVAEQLESKKLFWRVALKPGAPVLSCTYKEKVILALSGNPFGALATFELLLRPVLAHLAKDSSIQMKKITASVKEDFLKASPGRRIVRGIYSDGIVEIPRQGQASGILSTMKGCNCLVDIQNRKNGVFAGDIVEVWMI